MKLYDRQIRVLGVDVQIRFEFEASLFNSKRMKYSNVYITPLNGINSELAKNLVLYGINITIADDSIISE